MLANLGMMLAGAPMNALNETASCAPNGFSASDGQNGVNAVSAAPNHTADTVLSVVLRGFAVLSQTFSACSDVLGRTCVIVWYKTPHSWHTLY